MKAVPWEAFNKLQSLAPKLDEVSDGEPRLQDIRAAVRELLDGVMPFEKTDITDLGFSDPTLKNIQSAVAAGSAHPEPFRAALQFLAERGYPPDDDTESVAVKAVPSEALDKLQSFAPMLDEVSDEDLQLQDVCEAVQELLEGILPPEELDVTKLDFPDGAREAVSVAIILSGADPTTVRATQQFLDERGITASDPRQPLDQRETEDDLDDDTEHETFEEVIQRLARLSDVSYDNERKEEAKRLGIRLATLDREVKKEWRKKERQDSNRIAYYFFIAFAVIVAVIFAAA